MCKSQAEGGQRCAAHTRAKFTKAESALQTARSAGDPETIAAAQQDWEDAAAEYASTTEGHNLLTARGWDADGAHQWDTAGLYFAMAHRGERINEANKAAAETLRRSQTAPGWTGTPEAGYTLNTAHGQATIARDDELPGNWLVTVNHTNGTSNQFSHDGTPETARAEASATIQALGNASAKKRRSRLHRLLAK